MRTPPLVLPLTAALALATGSAHAFTPAGQDIVYDVNGKTFEGYLASAEEMEAAEAVYEIRVYSGAPHGFTVFDSDAYQERADAKSWAAFLELLEEAL